MSRQEILETDIKKRYDILNNEFQALKRKLNSKNEALLILHSELSETRNERDQYKLMAEQLSERYRAMKRGQISTPECLNHQSLDLTSQIEMDELKQRLADAEEDVKLLREKLVKQRLGLTAPTTPIHKGSTDTDIKEDLISQLEQVREQYSQLELDMKQVLDEREELVTERDTYKTKYGRLNQELNTLVRGDDKSILDIDAIILENKFLKQKNKHLEEEHSAATSAVSKYKRMLEKKKPTTSILKTTTNHVLGSLLFSQQQIKNLLTMPNEEVATAPQVVQELKNLASSLLDAINDKNIALNHQRKSNKLLGSRINDLENRIQEMELSGHSISHQEVKRSLQELLVTSEQISSSIPTDASRDSTSVSSSSDTISNTAEDVLDDNSMPTSSKPGCYSDPCEMPLDDTDQNFVESNGH